MSILASRHCFITFVTRATGRATSKLSYPCHEHEPTKLFRGVHSSTFQSVAKHASQSSSLQQVKNIFIQALIRASHCSNHDRSLHTNKAQKKSIKGTKNNKPVEHSHVIGRRKFSSKCEQNGPMQAIGYSVSKEELRGLVDFYSYRLEDEHNATSIGLNSGGMGLLPAPDDAGGGSKIDIEKAVRTLRQLLEDGTTPHDEIWRIYRTLPHPSASHLDDKLLNHLLHHLSVLPLKTEMSMVRYLTLFEDLRALNFRLKPSAWTSALAFVGRCLKVISSTQVDSVLNLWRQMEHEAGAKSTHITFNVLFDIATKSGKFVLAEMVMKEMEKRQLEFNRHFRTGLIYHYGLRRDGNGVRKAYRDLVEAGEMVDSAVITCVIKSLLSCGESVAAEQVFERAKRLHFQKLTEYDIQRADYEAKLSADSSHTSNSTSNHHNEDILAPVPPALTPTNWRAARILGHALDEAARDLRSDPDPTRHALVQDNVSLAPSPRTYIALIYFHAVTAGDLDRATELLGEMSSADFGTLGGSVHLIFFKGFSMHGGVAYTAWTRRRLESAWRDFGAAVDRSGLGWVCGRAEGDAERHERLLQDPPEEPPTFMSLVAAEYVLRAFGKVAGYERTMQVWSEILARWGDRGVVGERAMSHIEAVLAKLFPDVFEHGVDGSVQSDEFTDESENEGEDSASELEEYDPMA